MALDFPNSPTVGQTYAGYIYDGTKWKASPTSVAPSVVSATPPSNPTVGDMWFNSTDGTMYFYYNDGGTSQWVESRAPIVANGYYSPNYIINGGMDIAQRGTSFAGTGWAYPADRFTTVRNNYDAGMTASRQTSGLAGIQYCVRIQRNSGNTLTSILFMRYGMETVQSIPLQGKTATISFYARKGADLTAAPNFLLYTGTGVDQPTGAVDSYTGSVTQVNASPSLTTSWVRYSYTFTMPSNATQIGFEFKYTPTGTAGTNDYYEITGVQLEEGSAATTFRRSGSSLAEELAACQRYYWRMPAAGLYTRFASCYAFATSQATATIFSPVTMRIAPTALEWSGLGLSSDNGSVSVPSSIVFEYTASNAISILMMGTWVQYRPYVLLANNAPSAYLGFTAEI